MDTALQVGKKLVALCNAGKNDEAMNTLYAQNIVAIEAMPGTPQMPQKLEGIDAVRKKSEWWYENHEIHSGVCTGPWPHGDRFITCFKYEVTPKIGPHAGKRITIDEAALYTVKDGKIAKEEFFYDMGT
jgi:ketosteroid isomerase-like protein